MKIETTIDEIRSAFIIRMPEKISLDVLKSWRRSFLTELTTKEGSAALLLDTNRHEFESISCLQLLREILTEFSEADTPVVRVAFVQPDSSRQPEIVSDSEAYFSEREAALRWLRDRAF